MWSQPELLLHPCYKVIDIRPAITSFDRFDQFDDLCAFALKVLMLYKFQRIGPVRKSENISKVICIIHIFADEIPIAIYSYNNVMISCSHLSAPLHLKTVWDGVILAESVLECILPAAASLEFCSVGYEEYWVASQLEVKFRTSRSRQTHCLLARACHRLQFAVNLFVP